MSECNGFTLKLTTFYVSALRKEKYFTRLFNKIRNKMTGHFLYYLLQHKKITPKDIENFRR